jgi:hypothetical protein
MDRAPVPVFGAYRLRRNRWRWFFVLVQFECKQLVVIQRQQHIVFQFVYLEFQQFIIVQFQQQRLRGITGTGDQRWWRRDHL